MFVNVHSVNEITRVEIVGDIDGQSAPQIQAQVTEWIRPNSQLLLDMSKVNYMSSSGLRMLLGTYRAVTKNDGKIVLVGVNKEIKDTMSATGFLRFFAIYDTVEAGSAALA